MTTPTTTNSVVRVVQQAYENCKRVGIGQEPSSEQYVKGFNKFNDLVTFLVSQGMKIFQLVDYSLQSPILTQGINVYTFGTVGDVVTTTKPARFEKAYFVDQFGSTRDIIEMSWDEYVLLPNITQQGQPVNWLQKRNPTNIQLNLWQTPDAYTALGQVHIIIRQGISRGVSITDDTQFPPEWFLPLSWMLADELAPGTSADIMKLCAMKSTYYKQQVEDWDQETVGISFKPDDRAQYDRDYY